MANSDLSAIAPHAASLLVQSEYFYLDKARYVCEMFSTLGNPWEVIFNHRPEQSFFDKHNNIYENNRLVRTDAIRHGMSDEVVRALAAIAPDLYNDRLGTAAEPGMAIEFAGYTVEQIIDFGRAMQGFGPTLFADIGLDYNKGRFMKALTKLNFGQIEALSRIDLRGMIPYNRDMLVEHLKGCDAADYVKVPHILQYLSQNDNGTNRLRVLSRLAEYDDLHFLFPLRD